MSYIKTVVDLQELYDTWENNFNIIANRMRKDLSILEKNPEIAKIYKENSEKIETLEKKIDALGVIIKELMKK